VKVLTRPRDSFKIFFVLIIFIDFIGVSMARFLGTCWTRLALGPAFGGLVKIALGGSALFWSSTTATAPTLAWRFASAKAVLVVSFFFTNFDRSNFFAE